MSYGPYSTAATKYRIEGREKASTLKSQRWGYVAFWSSCALACLTSVPWYVNIAGCYSPAWKLGASPWNLKPFWFVKEAREVVCSSHTPAERERERERERELMWTPLRSPSRWFNYISRRIWKFFVLSNWEEQPQFFPVVGSFLESILMHLQKVGLNQSTSICLLT